MKCSYVFFCRFHDLVSLLILYKVDKMSSASAPAPISKQFSKTVKSQHTSQAWLQFDLMRREGRFTDTVLVADGRQFPVHKLVLCSCSPYFDRMFQAGFLEQDSGTVVLKDFDSETLGQLLDFMYTATITINEDNVQDILIGSNLLLLYEVREAAGEVLGHLIDHNNVLHIKALASTFSCREVESKAHNFLLERFEMVNTTEEFLKLDHKELSKYLSMDDIIVKSEESIFECILRWINVDSDKRSPYFDNLIPNVRFALLSEQYLNNQIKSNNLVKSSKICEQIIKEAEILRANQKTGEGGAMLAPNVPQYRGSNQLLFLQSANFPPWLKNPPVLFDFKKNKWKTVNGPSSRGNCRYRDGSCYVYHEGIIYSVGGEYFMDQPPGIPEHPAAMIDDRDIVLDNQVYSFTLDKRMWSVHSAMLTKRKRHQAVICNGKIFAIGGTNELSRTLDTVEILDLNMGSLEWEEGRSMVNRRVSHGAVVINNCIYVVGGWDGQGVVKSVEMFNTNTNEWTVVSQYNGVRMKSGVAALDGKIYVVGGCLQTLESCYKAEVFDPISLQWRELPDSKHARASPTLVPYRGIAVLDCN